jgi:hypothetical protein
MTTLTDTSASPSPSPPTERKRWRLVALIATAVAVVAIAVAVFAAVRDNGPSRALTARDVAVTQQARAACQQWLTNTSTPAANASTLCGHMTDWMYDHMASGQMGSMMWGTPQAMRQSCAAAMTGYVPAGTDPTQWCNNMIDWMTQHYGGWVGWMMGR